jgi:uncharacterized protein (DUF58 family)
MAFLAVAIVGVSVVHNVNFLRLLFAMILVVLTVGGWRGRRQLDELTVRRIAPPMTAVGRAAVCVLEVASRRRRSAYGVSVRDHVEPAPASRCRWIRLPTIAPGGSTTCRYDFLARTRGEFHFGPARLKTAFPFGFVEWILAAPDSTASEPLVVHPPFGALRLSARRQLGLTSPGAGRGAAALMEGVDEIRCVRDYRAGDPPKLIHWRSTARRGDFVVRELEPPATGNLLVVVDLAAAPADPLVETVLSFAATLAFEVCRGGRLELTMLVAGREPSAVRGAARPQRLPAYLRPLAIARASSDPNALPDALRLLRNSDVRDRQLWFVSAAAPPADASDRLASAGLRRCSSRRILDASAGDLDSVWTPPGAADGPPRSP